MKSPCYKCLLLASCRHKEFKALLDDCRIAFNFLWPTEFHKCNKSTTILMIEKDLSPARWFVVVDKPSGNASVIDYPSHKVISGNLYPGALDETDPMYKE